MSRPALLVLSLLLLVTGVVLVVDHEFGTTQPRFRAGTTTVRQAVSGGPSESPAGATTRPPGTLDRSGVPVRLEIPFGSANHPHGVTADVSADPLLPTGELFVPENPRQVSWSRDDAAPGAARGTAILTGHVDYGGIEGAFSDLAEYAATAVGKTFSVVLADGRSLTYRITGGAEYDKDQLAAHPELRQQIYDQTNSFGPAPGTGRLVLVSCGGAFDNRTGNYADNVFVFATPLS